MNCFTLLLTQWLSILLLFSTCCLSQKIPRLTPLYESILRHSNSQLTSSKTQNSDDVKTYYYKQTLDHFNYGPQSYATFDQRYMVNSKYWGGAKSKAPIFAWLGAESSIDSDPLYIGFLTDIAPRFKALLVYIEHRYYGKSIPFGTMQEAMKNETTRGYFNSAQALADYAEILLYIKNTKYNSQHSPIIVMGGSYGGMLASWFRLKYPHVALGALASSAPILYFDNITPENGYYSKVTQDFREASESCYQTIKKSWSVIDDIASKPNGLSILSRKFKICGGLKSVDDLNYYLDSMYSSAAQYDRPPEYPVKEVCAAIDGGAAKGTDILDRIHAGVAAAEGNRSCYDPYSYNPPNSETIMGWRWQTCSEMAMPIGRGASDTMFFPSPFSMEQYSKDCKHDFGVSPRPHWITTYYGGHDIKLVLRKFGSNIIFSNGLRDPYSTGGVLENISDTILVVYTRNGSHCLDIYGARKTDPDWLTEQRKKEVKIMQSWLTKYYFELIQAHKNRI